MSVRAARVLAASLLLPSFLFALGAHAAEKRLDRTFDVTPGGTLTVEADGSDITVTGGEGSKVVVLILLRGSQNFVDHMELSADATSGGVAVSARHKGGVMGWINFGTTEASVTVQVPTNYNVDLRTSGGDIKVARLEGTAKSKTSGGDVEAADVRGPVSLHTSGGDVTASNINGRTEVETSGGDVTVRTVTGDVDATTSGGEILVEQITGATRARSSSGDVVARNVRGNVDLHSSGGDIKGVAIDGQIRASTSGGDIEAELVGENRGIHATSSGGGIVLHLPADVGGMLDASSSGGSIKTELPVTTTEAGERRLTGKINGGGAEIFARTSGGNVRLLARK